MAKLLETCQRCGWSHQLSFVYHGGVPVEHPLCPSCGDGLRWEYTFEDAEAGGSGAALRAAIALDEVGLPEDRSPRVLRLQARIEQALEAQTGSALRFTNIGGHVDLEIRPYVDAARGVAGAKVVACVGQAVSSAGLRELLVGINAQLQQGAISAHAHPYGAPPGAASLQPFGTPVSLLYQHVIPEADLESGAWVAQWEAAGAQAQWVARLFAQTARLDQPLALAPRAAHPVGPAYDEGERSAETLEREVLEPLLRFAPDADEIRERLQSHMAALSLDVAPDARGVYTFACDSARVEVASVERGGRLLVSFSAVLLSELDLQRMAAQDAELLPRLLTHLNDQLLLGRCVLEAQPGAAHRIVYETTLLSADLDLSELAVTLAVVAEQADAMDDLLQEGLGGLRADQVESLTTHRRQDGPPPCDVRPLLARLEARQVPGVRQIGAEIARVLLAESLEELRLPVTQDAEGNAWFTFGSARLCAHLWEDNRATWLTLSSPVLRNLERVEGVAVALNDLNRAIPTGAFALQEDRHILLVQTLPADDLAVEELAYALVTLGELADHYDNILQESFGGQLAAEPRPTA